MSWDPTVLRKYSTTSHFRLLNQLRSELNTHPLVRRPGGEIHLGIPRRGSSYRVPLEERGTGASARGGRAQQPVDPPVSDGDALQSDSTSFRDRLRAIEMR
ncbi:MAG: hypothetical protein ACK6BG_07085 [Cyanobacteriota bacterium]